MVTLKWTEQALNDVGCIAEYIASDSVFYAKIFSQKIFKSVDRIAKIFSQKIFKSVDRIKNNLIEIITVYHSSRLLNIVL
ncbi:MAG: hypothetical protein B6I31_02760 [Desulfobacteraceae bacterium 4572_19]|nr:MAG: hypothetical protein B6I31_02760 [Desulfobacteraceae bacterium 4572_19]